MNKENKKIINRNHIFIIVTLLFFFSAIFSNFYHFLFIKDYKYIVEASCDPLLEDCNYRDCSNADDCPPNGFSYYKEFYVDARDFKKCGDNSCKKECEAGLINCEYVPCDIESNEDCLKFEE